MDGMVKREHSIYDNRVMNLLEQRTKEVERRARQEKESVEGV